MFTITNVLMKKVLKIVGVLVLVVFVLVVGAISYVMLFLPNVGKAPQLSVAATPERVKRGEYLANNVAVCMDCHSKRDQTLYAAPMSPGTLGQGGEMFDKTMGFPGVFYSRNITPYGIGKWTDGELFRAITTGVDRSGSPLFPLMPYHYYGTMDTEDVYSIIAYLRTLPAIKNDVPPSKADFPMNVIMHLIPQKAAPVVRPQPTDTIAYGKYLVNMATCVECHTKFEKGQIVNGQEFGGGREFQMPYGMLHSPNITPHATGIGSWTCEQFVSRFKQYQSADYHPQKVGDKDFNTIMPWMMYSRMTESDLVAIYKFLRTVKPIDNTVNRFTAK
jgi:cytochrome c2